MSNKKSQDRKVFISHSHDDCHMAVKLQKILHKKKVETFLDQDTIDTLDNLPTRINEGLSWCNYLLLIWSADAAKSAWVQREWQTAHKRRKTIIPYVLDGTALPYLLDETVYIDPSDQLHGNVELLGAIGIHSSGEGELFPGLWDISMDAFGMVQGSYRIELRKNGQVEGEGGISNTGVAGGIAEQLGVASILSMRIPVHGTWKYESGPKLLTIDITAEAMDTRDHYTIRVRATGHEKGAITGEDFGGRTWTLLRLGDQLRSPLEEEKQGVRNVLQSMIDNHADSPTLPLTLAAVCIGVQEKSQYNLGLPTKKARRLMQANEQTFAGAWQDFLHALENGGWVS